MTHCRHVIASAAALALGLASAARAAEPTNEELKQKLAELEAKVAALENRNTADIDATIDGVLKDADRRSKFLADNEGGSAGWDNGFFIKQDGFLFKPGAQLQFRNVTDMRDDGKHGDEWDTQQGFEFRRARLDLAGTLFTPDLQYYVQWDVNRTNGSFNLLDALVKYRFTPDWSVQGGQFKDWVFHEEDVSDKVQLAVEKSVVNDLLGGGVTGRVQGVSLIYGDYQEDHPLYAQLTFHDGDKSLNTDYRDNGINFGVSARAEYKVTGDWKAYSDFSARKLKQDLLVLGAGVDASQGDNFTQYSGTVDAQYKHASGFSIFGALLGQQVDPRNAADDDSSFNWGALVQGAYELTPQWELFGRYDISRFENDLANGRQTVQELGAGVNYFLGKDGSWGHRAKITVDVVYLPNGAPALLNEDIQGGTGKAEIVIRAQLNLVI